MALLELIIDLSFISYRPQRSCGQGYVFTPVCDSVHRGGLRAGRTPLGRETSPGADTHPLGRETPPQQTPPPPGPEPAPPAGRTPSPGQGEPPQSRPPRSRTPPKAHSIIRSTSGRYASYWNAFLFIFLLPFRVEYTMAQGGKWVTRGYDQSLRSPCDHAYYLGKFLRMDHPEMKTIPTIEEHHIVDPIYLQEGPEYLCYKVSDKVKSSLKNTHQDYAQFEMRDLVHNTSLDDFLSIIEESLIRPSKKERQIEGIGTFHLSWWGLSFDKEITRRYKSEMQKVLFGAGIDYESKPQRIQLLNSSPFCQPSRYGNYRITIPINKMIEYYEESFGECQRRILWTEIFYRCEVDHTLLVHPKTREFSELFKDLPLMDEYLEIQGKDGVIKGIGGKWFWCPQSTSIFHPESKPSECKYKAWDQLTFAFLIPEEREWKKCEGIKIPDEDWEGFN